MSSVGGIVFAKCLSLKNVYKSNGMHPMKSLEWCAQSLSLLSKIKTRDHSNFEGKRQSDSLRPRGQISERAA